MSNRSGHKQARCMWMRGGTSKGGYFLAEDLPVDPKERDAFLLRVMGSPDLRQIDGMGGADPLTSKVAVVKKSQRDGVDVDYLFLQVFVDQALVSDAQNCGNILAGVAPFAIERELVPIAGDETDVAVYMENTGQIAILKVQTPNGAVNYTDGNAALDGVPGTAAPIGVTFKDTAGSSCGALYPTGNLVDEVDGVKITCIDNGMPVVILQAEDFSISGKESREDLDHNEALKSRLESIRLQIGPKMNLGDVREKSVPKMTLVSKADHGGAIATRSFIPHRCHASIGVLGAVSVATACLAEGSPIATLSQIPDGTTKLMNIEHPTGQVSVLLEMENNQVKSAAVLRTARKLFDGIVFG